MEWSKLMIFVILLAINSFLWFFLMNPASCSFSISVFVGARILVLGLILVVILRPLLVVDRMR